MSPIKNDPYCYPGTDVLRNLAETHDPKALESFEADATAANIIDFRVNPITGPFDTRRLQETHRRIFGNVYLWAGEFRKGIGMMPKLSPGGWPISRANSTRFMHSAKKLAHAASLHLGPRESGRSPARMGSHRGDRGAAAGSLPRSRSGDHARRYFGVDADSECLPGKAFRWIEIDRTGCRPF